MPLFSIRAKSFYTYISHSIFFVDTLSYEYLEAVAKFWSENKGQYGE